MHHNYPKKIKIGENKYVPEGLIREFTVIRGYRVWGQLRDCPIHGEESFTVCVERNL